MTLDAVAPLLAVPCLVTLLVAALDVAQRGFRFLAARRTHVSAGPDWDWPDWEGDEWDDVREAIHRERDR